jgi:replicative DNA helicase
VSDQQHNNSRDQRRKDISNGIKGTDYRANPQAEQLLIASFILYPDVFFEFSQFLTETDFTVYEYSQVFYLLTNFYEESRENLTLVKFEAIANEKGFTNLSNDEQIGYLFDIPITKAEAPGYFNQVKRETVRRLYGNKTDEIGHYIDHTDDSAIKIISSIEELILDTSSILRYGEEGIVNLAEDAEAVIRSIGEDPGSPGLDVGFPIWQKYIGELCNGTVHMVIASAKVGKSMKGLHAAVHVTSKYNKPTLLCDSEMTEKQQIIRAFGMYAKIPFWVMRYGYWNLSDEELFAKKFPEGSQEFFTIKQARLKIGDAELWRKFKTFPLYYLSIKGKSVSDILPMIRQWIMRYTSIDKDAKVPQAFLVYDYIKLATVDEMKAGLQEYQILGLSVGKLHDFCNKYNIPCLTFGQTNRDTERHINCIAGSKRLVELADSITILFKKNDEDRLLDPSGTHGFAVVATREGEETEGGYISFKFDRSMGFMEELGYVNMAALRYENNKRKNSDS